MGVGVISKAPTFACVAKSKRATRRWRLFTRFDQESANVDEDEGKLGERHKHGIPLAAEWVHREVNGQEDDAEEQRDEDAGLLGVLRYKQHPARQRQLPTHLERLPPP